MELFKLVGKIMVDSAEANNSIAKTGKEAEGLGGKLAGGIKTAAKWAAGVGAAATAVGGAMVAAAKSTAKSLDEVDKASQRMKVGAEAYQELAHAANLSGVEMSTLEKAAKKLEGTDLNFNDAINQIMSIGDESARTQAAIDMFGESVAYQMTPLLAAGADGLAAMRKEANDLGLVMSQETVTSGAALNDMFTKVESSVQALKNGLMADLMPYVMEILDFVVKNMPVIKQTVQNVMGAIMPIVKPILNGVLILVQAVFKLINGDFEGFKEGIKTALKKFGEGLLTLGKDAMSYLWSGFKSVWNGIHEWVQDKIGWLKDKLTFWRDSQNEMSGGERGGYGNSGTYSAYSGGAGRTTETQNINVMVDGEVLTTAVVNRVRNEARMA